MGLNPIAGSRKNMYDCILKLAKYYEIIASVSLHTNGKDLLSKYSWMIPVFEMFFSYTAEQDPSSVIAWLEHNQFEIESILSDFPDPQFLGKGNNGVAFSLDDGTVLKFVKKFDYDKAVEMQNKLYNKEEGAQYLPNIYSYGSFEPINPNQPDIYYVIMEKAIVRPKAIKGIETSIHQDFRLLKKIIDKHIFALMDMDKDLSDDQLAKRVYNKLIMDIDHNTLDRIVNLLGNGNYEWLLQLLKSFVIQMKENNYDLHWQNFGTRHNQPNTPVIFDS